MTQYGVPAIEGRDYEVQRRIRGRGIRLGGPSWTVADNRPGGQFEVVAAGHDPAKEQTQERRRCQPASDRD